MYNRLSVEESHKNQSLQNEEINTTDEKYFMEDEVTIIKPFVIESPNLNLKRRQLGRRGQIQQIQAVEKDDREYNTYRYLIKDISLDPKYSTLQIRELKKYSFKDIVHYIKECDAYKNGCNIEITECEIKIGISLQELQASFPLIFTFFSPRTHRIVTEKTFSEFSTLLSDCEWKSVRDLQDEQENIFIESEIYFRHLEKNNYVKSIKSKNGDIPSKIILDILENNPCLIIGEKHEDTEPKKQLIENMSELKKRGLTHIFVEHLLLDTQEELLLKYFNAETSFENMPTILKEYLYNLDQNFKLNKNDNLYNFLNLLIEAKKNDIKVIAIDTAASYSVTFNKGDYSKRCAAMNFIFAKQLNKYVNDPLMGLKKYIVFCGSRHINNINSDGIPGVDTISGGITVVIEDISADKKFQSANDHIAKPDVLIQVYANNEYNTSINTIFGNTNINLKNEEIIIQPLISQDNPKRSITPSKAANTAIKKREKFKSERIQENSSQSNKIIKNKKNPPANDPEDQKLKKPKNTNISHVSKKRVKTKSHKISGNTQFSIFKNKKRPPVNNECNKHITPLTNTEASKDKKMHNPEK